MKIKKALFYLISFLSLSAMFSVCYYLSYKNALRQFNKNAVERNNELILSLENNGLLQNNNQSASNKGTEPLNQGLTQNGETITDNSVGGESVAAEAVKDTILPTTQYTLQTFDMKSNKTQEETLPIPSYLVGLTRKEVMVYLYDYMQDLSWNEYEKGLTSFELMEFSKDHIVLRKTYNPDSVINKYYLKSQDGYIVVYYGDKKTVYDYTTVSVENLSQYEKLQLQEGIYVKDLDELYAVLENYSS